MRLITFIKAYNDLFSDYFLLRRVSVEVSVVFHSILLISILIIIGVIVARSYPFNNDTRKMFITLITNVAMPAIILSSIFSVEIDKETFKVLIVIFILSVAINITGLVLGYLFIFLFKRNSEKKIEIAILSAFGNTAFIGIPLCAVLFGPEGALYAAIFDAGVDFTIWTVGVYLLQQERKFNLNLLKNLINLPLISIILGLIIAMFEMQVPLIVIDITDMLASFAVPLAMFFIGAVVSNLQRTQIKISYFEVTIPIFIKLILLPFIVILFLMSSGLSELIINVVIIQSMMPTITLSSILFAKYLRDDKLGAFIIILSTFASLLVIPAVLYIIETLYG